MKMNYCPECGVAWDAWEPDPVKCWNCGTPKPGEVVSEIAPTECHEHKKYEGKGAPTSDCPTCWKMHKVYTDNKVRELSSARD